VSERPTSSIFEEPEVPQASRELAELRTAEGYVPPFRIIRRRVTDDYYEGAQGTATVDATIVICVGDVEEIEAARGVGVVNALDLALRKALLKYFPFLQQVRVAETYMHASGESTEAEVMSVKRFTDGHATWTTLSRSPNTVEAGWQSLVDGYEWRIIREVMKQRRAERHNSLPRS
jgi:2-isopropylmalate synthase